MPRRHATLKSVCGLIAVLSVIALPLLVHARQWQDASGRFQVEGEYIAADEDMVVIETADGDLITLEIEQLSDADRDFVRQNAKQRRDAVPRTAPPAPTTSSLEPTPPPEPTSPEAAAAEQTDRPVETAGRSMWDLKDGQAVFGQLLGFGSQSLTLLRKNGEIHVNGQPIQDVPAAYLKIIPNVVSQVDGVAIEDFDALEEHLIDAGGGPVEYVVEGIEVQLDTGSQIVVPIELLASPLAKQVQPGFARWKAAQAEEVEEEKRYAVEKRERLMLDSYNRVYRAPRGGEAPLAPTRRMQFLQLQMLAADAGVVDIWEVGIRPPVPYAFPYTVLVPAENSLAAQQQVIQQYPGWQVIGVAKESF